MHFLCVVVGDRPADTLYPFAQYNEVEKYKFYLKPAEVSSMAEHYGVPVLDLAALAAKLPEWQGAEGGIDGGRLFFWSTENPQGKFDWYKVGGRFSGYFRLMEPAAPTWWRRILGKGPLDRANRALKRQIDLRAILEDPPAALLVDGVWHECSVTQEEQKLMAWKAEFSALFEKVPGDAVLTAVDMHS